MHTRPTVAFQPKRILCTPRYHADLAKEYTLGRTTAYLFNKAVDTETINPIGPGNYDVENSLGHIQTHAPTYSISTIDRDCDLASKEFYHQLPPSRGPWSDIEKWDKSVYLEPKLPRIPDQPKQGPYANKYDESNSLSAEQTRALNNGLFKSTMRGPMNYASTFKTKQAHIQYPLQVTQRGRGRA